MNNRLSWAETAQQMNSTLRQYLKFILATLVLMLGFRLLAHGLYETPKQIQMELTEKTADLFRAYWIGGRFDFSALCYISIFPFLGFWFAFFRRQQSTWLQVRKIVPVYLLVMITALTICLACDTGYYSYFQDHLNVLIFAMIEDDTRALLLLFWKNYPVLWFTAALVFFVIGLRRFLLSVFAPLRHQPPSKSAFLFFPVILSLPVLALGARGSVNLFPLSVQDTVVSDRAFLNHLAYNGFHALIRAIKLKKAQTSNWDADLVRYGYQNPRQAFADFFEIPLAEVPEDPNQLLQHTSQKNAWAKKTKPHVLVIMMESFGSAYFQFHSPNFNLLADLQTQFEKNFSTLNFFPSHSSTIGSLSSFMISFPQRPDAGFLTESETLQSTFSSSAARIFKAQGYQSRFVYGGNPGWRDVNKFALFQGFDSVEGEIDIEKSLGPLAEKHDWGVFDEDVFRYLEKELLSREQPQMILAMTTSNHPPYQVPSSYQARPQQIPEHLQSRIVADPSLVKKRFLTYQYSNQKLAEFLARVEKSPLREKLIIAVTGDHSFWLVNFDDHELLQKWGVPLLFVVPPQLKSELKWDSQVYGSHFDVFPTLYNLALNEAPYVGLGRNLFEHPEQSWAAHSSLIGLSAAGGILAQKGPDAYTPLAWDSEHRLRASAARPELDRLAKKYKSLMSITDYYLMSQTHKERSKK